MIELQKLLILYKNVILQPKLFFLRFSIIHCIKLKKAYPAFHTAANQNTEG